MLRIIIFITLLLPSYSSAQNSNRWRNIGIEDGLSNLSINDLVQDSMGYVWFATNEGFNRYDGEFIRKYPLNDSLKIAQSPIIDLLVDGSYIWLVIKGKGLFRYHPGTDVSEAIAPLQDIDIYSLRLVRDELWVSTPRMGLIRYDKITKRVIYHFEKHNNIINTIPYGIDSMLCSLVGVGLFHLSVEKDTADEFKSNYRPLQRNQSEEKTIYTCHNLQMINGDIWAGCWDNAIHKLSGDQFTSYLLPGEDQLSYEGEEINILAKQKDDLFVGSKNGNLYWFKTADATFEEVNKDGFKGEVLKSVLIDKDQRLWIGTEQGVNFIETQDPLFKIIDLKSKAQQAEKVQALAKCDGAVYIGSNNGLYKYEDQLIRKIENDLKDRRIHSLISNEDYLFVGTATTVYEMDKKTNAIRDIFKSPIILPKNHNFIPGQLKYSRYKSLAIQESDYGRLLFASAYGYAMVIYHLDEDWHTFSLLDGQLKETLYNDAFVDEDNKLYLCGEQDGFFVDVQLYFPSCQDDAFFEGLDLRKKCQLEYMSLRAEKTYTSHVNTEFISNSFTQTLVDSIGNIWVGTPSGLFEINQEIEKKDFLFNEISSFALDANRIWSVSNNGLQYIDGQNSPIYHGTDSGIPESGLSGPILINEEELILGGNGFVATALLSDFEVDTNHAQELYLSNIHTLKDKKNPEFNDGVYTIHESNNGLSLSVVVIDFISAAENKFSYSITELYDFWIDNGNNNEILLPGLKGGNYELVVRAKDRNGILISEPLSLMIYVKKHWYNSWWFRALIGLFLASTVWVWFLNKQRQKNKVVQMRDNISRDLHDDVGSLLGSISIYTAAAVNALKTGKPEETKTILNKIGNHSRTMIDNMSDIVWSINTDQDTLGDLFDKMKIFAVDIFQAKGIITHYNMDTELILQELSMEKRKNIYLIFKEVVHNILKHSEAEEVWIDMSRQDGRLLISIKDNGVGFDLNKAYDTKRNGLKSMNKRAEEIKATIDIISEIDEGAEVRLIV